MCVILLYTNACVKCKNKVMCFVCTLVSRRKTPLKNNHQNRKMHSRHSDDEKGDDVFHHHQMVFEQKKKFTKKNETLFKTSFFMHRAYFVLIVFQPN